MQQITKNLPKTQVGQTSELHEVSSSVSVCPEVQSAVPPARAAVASSSQVRVRVRVPPPQVTEHDDQLSQQLQRGLLRPSEE